MSRQPAISQRAPFVQHMRGQRIGQTRGDEVGRAPLPPVRQFQPMAVDFLAGVEGPERHDESSLELQLVQDGLGMNRVELKLWTTFQHVTKPFAKSCGRASTQALMSSGLNQSPVAISSGRQRMGPS